MSTSHLYHLFGINQVHSLKTVFEGGCTVLHAAIHPNAIKCPDCRSRRVIRFGQIPRTFKMLPVGHKKVALAVSIPRICCHDCGAVKQIVLPFADSKKHYTRALERYVVDLCRITTLHRISTGKLEAMNGRIKTLQRNAYGYRDEQYFNLRIFNLHNQNYALVG